MQLSSAAVLEDNNASDDAMLPFTVPDLKVRGRVVRLATSVDELIGRHAFPEPISRLMAEALALTSLLGSSLKFSGKFVLQTQSDGIVDFLVSDYEVPSRVRGYCRFDEERFNTEYEPGMPLLGDGHLAFTIDQGSDMQRYQGIVPLEGTTLVEAAESYFRQSEQIPTIVRLAASPVYTGPTEDGTAGVKAWRAGGIIAQFLPDTGGTKDEAEAAFLGAQEDFESIVEPGDLWREASALVETVEDHELIDPMVSSERLLYRLFHERGVRVFDRTPVELNCRCSRERILNILKQFTPEERTDMLEDGKIQVKCEFCAKNYEFDPAEVEAIDQR